MTFHAKLRRYQWRASGAGFPLLRGKFEELAPRWAAIADELAEQTVARGGAPPSFLRLATDLSGQLPRASCPSAEETVEVLTRDIEHISGSIARCIATATSQSDTSLVHLLRGIHDEQLQTLWMLRAWVDAAACEPAHASPSC
jgi:DNA-binding ferritin-like protein